MRNLLSAVLIMTLGMQAALSADDTAAHRVVVRSELFSSSNFLRRGMTWDGLASGRWHPKPWYRPVDRSGGYWLEVVPVDAAAFRKRSSKGWWMLRFQMHQYLWIKADPDLTRLMAVGNPPGTDYRWAKGGVRFQSLASAMIGIRTEQWWAAVGIGKGGRNLIGFGDGRVYFPESADTIYWRMNFRQSVVPDNPALVFSGGYQWGGGDWGMELKADQWGLWLGKGIQRSDYAVEVAYAAADPFDTARSLDKVRAAVAAGVRSLENPTFVERSAAALLWGTLEGRLTYRRFQFMGKVWPGPGGPYWFARLEGNAMPDGVPWQVTPFAHFDAAGAAGIGMGLGYRRNGFELRAQIPFIWGIPRKSGLGAAVHLQTAW